MRAKWLSSILGVLVALVFGGVAQAATDQTIFQDDFWSIPVGNPPNVATTGTITLNSGSPDLSNSLVIAPGGANGFTGPYARIYKAAGLGNNVMLTAHVDPGSYYGDGSYLMQWDSVCRTESTNCSNAWVDGFPFFGINYVEDYTGSGEGYIHYKLPNGAGQSHTINAIRFKKGVPQRFQAVVRVNSDTPSPADNNYDLYIDGVKAVESSAFYNQNPQYNRVISTLELQIGGAEAGDYGINNMLIMKLGDPWIPNPVIKANGGFSAGGYDTYNISVTNFASYPDQLFADLPTVDNTFCNGNKGSRTNVEIWGSYPNSDDPKMATYCQITASSQLANLSFQIPAGSTPPTSVYVVFTDSTGTPWPREYTSNYIPITMLVNVDSDGDGIPDSADNCKYVYNPDQKDSDADNIGDVCDPCPMYKNGGTYGSCPDPTTIVSGSGALVNDPNLPDGSVQVCVKWTDPAMKDRLTFLPNCYNTYFAAEDTSTNPPTPLVPNCLVPPPYNTADAVPIVLNHDYCTVCSLGERFMQYGQALSTVKIKSAYYEQTASDPWIDPKNCDPITGICACITGMSGCKNLWYGRIEIPAADVAKIPEFTIANPNIVPIKIKHGALKNPVHIRHNIKENIPVTIFGCAPAGTVTATAGKKPQRVCTPEDFNFDVKLVDPYSIEMAGASVKLKGKAQTPMVTYKDVDNDGLMDMTVQIEANGIDPTQIGEKAILGGTMCNPGTTSLQGCVGTVFQGAEVVKVIKCAPEEDYRHTDEDKRFCGGEDD